MENKDIEVTNKGTEEMTEGTADKKSLLSRLAVPAIIVLIIAVFGGIVYYAKFIKPRTDIDKEVGYKTEEYITLGKTTGFEYEITQEDFDKSVREETDAYGEVDRAAKSDDQIDFNYTAYIDDKKVEDLSATDVEFVINEAEDGVFKKFADAMLGLKPGDKTSVKIDGSEVNELSASKTKYDGQTVTFKLKLVTVSELEREKVTDKWVMDNYNEDYGLETAADFYEWIKTYLEDEAKTTLWQKAVDKATMSGYPQELYDDIVTEFTQDANYQADMFGMETEDYLMNFCRYTEKTLEEEYLNEVKSELVMWAIVKEKHFDTTSQEIEDKYEELYIDCGYDSVDAMKEDYKKEEIRKAVLLDKTQEYVYDNSNVKESFKIPTE